MKRLSGILILLLFLAATACAKNNPSAPAEAGQGSVPVETAAPASTGIPPTENESSGPLTIPALSGGLTCTNLDSDASMKEVRDILMNAGIPAEYIDTVLDWVKDYNDCMRECPSFSLIGDFITIEGTTVDYGDYYPMSTHWYKNNRRNYHDILCRIAAFELNQHLISVQNRMAKEDFDCWDQQTSWLCSDGEILFGAEAVEGEHKAYIPFPLIDWSEEQTAAYFTLFSPVSVEEASGEADIYESIQREWAERGISFTESPCSLVTVWTQSGAQACVSHAASLIRTEEGYLLFEKTNPESPYAAVKLSSLAEVCQYLTDMLRLDYSRYDSEPGACLILQNDRRIDAG